MQDSESSWPPAVGDRVRIRGGRLRGKIEKIEREGDEDRYILSIATPSPADAGDAYELAQAATTVRTSYRLDELEPRG